MKCFYWNHKLSEVLQVSADRGTCVLLTTTPLPWQSRSKPVVMTSLPISIPLKNVSIILMKIYTYEVWVG